MDQADTQYFSWQDQVIVDLDIFMEFVNNKNK